MSSSSREYSPDWLRNVKAPPTSIWTLSSTSDSEDDDQLPISSVVTNMNRNSLGETQANKGVRKAAAKNQIPKRSASHELSEGQHPHDVEVTSLKRASKLLTAETKEKSLTEQDAADDDDLKVFERETIDEKQTGPNISSSRLPLVLADKVQRSKVLVECEGESIDLSGDLGSVGRVVISDSPCGNQDMLLDLKGTIYKTTIMPSRTLCVVSFGQSEAKIEAIMNDFIQLKPQSNVYEAETMVEGTLEGFLFDSEDEGDKQRQTDENEPQTNGKTKEAAKKKGKTAAVKKPTAKKVNNNKKKAPVAKKTKLKK